MTELEQLARQYGGGYSDAALVSSKAYADGFLKAREMALAALDQSGSDPTGRAWDAINNLGESEVGV